MSLVAPEAWRPPVEFWGCDPVWRSSVKILAAHLDRLPWAAEGDVCWLNNHPIRDVDIVGIVVGLDPSQPREAEAKVRMTLDDGSGLVECIWWASGSAEHRAQLLGTLRLGCLVHVLGRIGRFREQRQVSVHQLWLEIDPAAEMYHWLRARELWRTVYSKPFHKPEVLERPDTPDVQPEAKLVALVLEQARALCTEADAYATSVAAITAELSKASRGGGGAAAQPAPGRGRPPASAERVATAAQVQLAVDKLVEASALYVVDDGPRARLYRLT
jgi:hypothetical protein